VLAEYTQIDVKDPYCCIEDFIRALDAESHYFPLLSLVSSDLCDCAGIIRKLDNMRTDD
jgi:hypothetical protein